VDDRERGSHDERLGSATRGVLSETSEDKEQKGPGATPRPVTIPRKGLLPMELYERFDEPGKRTGQGCHK
jgi:hypothetical protein